MFRQLFMTNLFSWTVEGHIMSEQHTSEICLKKSFTEQTSDNFYNEFCLLSAKQHNYNFYYECFVVSKGIVFRMKKIGPKTVP